MVLENKRKHKRVRVSLPLEIYDVLNDKNIVGRVVDISAGGVAAITEEELPVDTPISLTFEFEGIKFNKMSADVVRQILKENHYYLGIAFFNIKPGTQEEIDRGVRKVFSVRERGFQRGKIE